MQEESGTKLYACNPVTTRAEAGEPKAHGQPGQWDSVSKELKEKKEKEAGSGGACLWIQHSGKQRQGNKFKTSLHNLARDPVSKLFKKRDRSSGAIAECEGSGFNPSTANTSNSYYCYFKSWKCSSVVEYLWVQFPVPPKKGKRKKGGVRKLVFSI